MNVFATILFFGLPGFSIHMPTEQDCTDMLVTMKADITAALEKDPDGLLTDEGEVIRLEDIAFECRDKPLDPEA